MKKLALTIAIILGLSIGGFAQGGLFGYGEVSNDGLFVIAWNNLDDRTGSDPLMPGMPDHGQSNNQTAPLGSGALLLIGFGAAYALKKKSKK